jgi:translocation protein SEC72
MHCLAAPLDINNLRSNVASVVSTTSDWFSTFLLSTTMSHSHSHAPGEEHSHSHSHGPPQTPQSPQTPGMPPPDPVMQAMIEADFKPVPLSLSGDKHTITCEKHNLVKCDDCEVDFDGLNRLSSILANNPNLLCPPPGHIVTQKVTQLVTATKEDGNVRNKSICPTVDCSNTVNYQKLFKNGAHDQAIARYTAAASVAASRPPWENNQLMREELSTVISNRSASYFEAHDYISALTDAEIVISIRRPWSKGHFRKAKALLGLGRLSEAAEALRLGLSFEPSNTVCGPVIPTFL